MNRCDDSAAEQACEIIGDIETWFAHYEDAEKPLEQEYAAWKGMMADEYARLVQRIEQSAATVDVPAGHSAALDMA